jgi:hypothetical protein
MAPALRTRAATSSFDLVVTELTAHPLHKYKDQLHLYLFLYSFFQ